MVYEIGLEDQREKRICALGGHGFLVFSPLGHWPISKNSAAFYPNLIQETDKGKLIEQSGFISVMSWCGGVNFSVGVRGGYRI